MHSAEFYSVGSFGVIEVTDGVFVASKTISGNRIELGNFGTYEEAEQSILADEAAQPQGRKRCPDCDGAGIRQGNEECNMCAGTGYVST